MLTIILLLVHDILFINKSFWTHHNILKGTSHDFCWSRKPMNHFQKQGKIHIYQNKYRQQNPHKIDEIMKKMGFWPNFILGSTLSGVFNFLKFVMCGTTERKEIWLLKIEKIIYKHDTTINSWSSTPLKFENQDLHDLFLETLF